MKKKMRSYSECSSLIEYEYERCARAHSPKECTAWELYEWCERIFVGLYI